MQGLRSALLCLSTVVIDAGRWCWFPLVSNCYTILFVSMQRQSCWIMWTQYFLTCEDTLNTFLEVKTISLAKLSQNWFIPVGLWSYQKRMHHRPPIPLVWTRVGILGCFKHCKHCKLVMKSNVVSSQRCTMASECDPVADVGS